MCAKVLDNLLLSTMCPWTFSSLPTTRGVKVSHPDTHFHNPCNRIASPSHHHTDLMDAVRKLGGRCVNKLSTTSIMIASPQTERPTSGVAVVSSTWLVGLVRFILTPQMTRQATLLTSPYRSGIPAQPAECATYLQHKQQAAAAAASNSRSQQQKPAAARCSPKQQQQQQNGKQQQVRTLALTDYFCQRVYAPPRPKTHHTSHITHHTSHITHHTSHITHHTSLPHRASSSMSNIHLPPRPPQHPTAVSTSFCGEPGGITLLHGGRAALVPQIIAGGAGTICIVDDDVESE